MSFANSGPAVTLTPNVMLATGTPVVVLAPVVDVPTLNATYPAASYSGLTAQVGSAAPYALYVSNGTAWTIPGGAALGPVADYPTLVSTYPPASNNGKTALVGSAPSLFYACDGNEWNWVDTTIKKQGRRFFAKAQGGLAYNGGSTAIVYPFGYTSASTVCGGTSTGTLTLTGLTNQTSFVGAPLLFADARYGTVITGQGIPIGTVISAYQTATVGSIGRVGSTATYTITNRFGTVIPDVTSASYVANTTVIQVGASHCSQTVYKTLFGSQCHTALFTNCAFPQGVSNSGPNTDLPVSTDIRIYASMEFVGKDSSNVLKAIPLTFAGREYLPCPANVPVAEWCDEVSYPANAGENVIIHCYITHGDGVSPFTCPMMQLSAAGTPSGPGNVFGFGMTESVNLNGGDPRLRLSTDTLFWSGFSFISTQLQYKPIALASTQPAPSAKKAVVVTGDSIASPDFSWLQYTLQKSNLPFVTLAKSGEGQQNFPNNFAARGKAFFGDIYINELGTNNSGGPFSTFLPLYAYARQCGFKKVIQTTITPNCSQRIQIPNTTTISASGVLTITALTIGTLGTTLLEVGMAITGTGVNLGTKITTFGTNGTTGTGAAGTYQLVEATGAAYAGAASTNATIDNFNSVNLNTQNPNTFIVTLNAAIKAAKGTPTGPDVVWDISSQCTGTDPTKWAPGYTNDGVHPNTTLTALLYTYADAQNFIGDLT